MLTGLLDSEQPDARPFEVAFGLSRLAADCQSIAKRALSELESDQRGKSDMQNTSAQSACLYKQAEMLACFARHLQEDEKSHEVVRDMTYCLCYDIAKLAMESRDRCMYASF